jgi:hypothetical protein
MVSISQDLKNQPMREPEVAPVTEETVRVLEESGAKREVVKLARQYVAPPPREFDFGRLVVGGAALGLQLLLRRRARARRHDSGSDRK